MDDIEKLGLERKIANLEMELLKAKSAILQLQYEKKAIELMAIEGCLRRKYISQFYRSCGRKGDNKRRCPGRNGRKTYYIYK